MNPNCCIPRYYIASDGCVFEEYEAPSMADACEMARASWGSAEPGTYDVTVCEYETEDDRSNWGMRTWASAAYTTITVVTE